ncbi:MAG: hypothetical protein QM731_04145 [Chitinophagaceae bacterium]
MFKNRKKLIGVAIVAALAFACKKDDDTPAAEKILGEWSYSRTTYLYKTSNYEYKDTATGTDDDYVQFLSNGKLYLHLDGSEDTITYKVLGNTSIIIDGDTASISKLNGNEFEYYFQVTDGVAIERVDVAFKR